MVCSAASRCDDGGALGEERVLRRGGEEGLPVLGLALDEVEAVPGVGDDPVEVDDRPLPWACGNLGHAAKLPAGSIRRHE